MLAILRCSRETNTLQHTAASWCLKLDQKKWVNMIEKVWFSHPLTWMKIWIGNYQLIDKWYMCEHFAVMCCKNYI